MKIHLLQRLRSAALIQGVLALMFGGTVCYLAIVSREIPGILLALLGTIIGFYFGTEKAAPTT